MTRAQVPARNMNPIADEKEHREENRRHGRIRTRGLTARLGLLRYAEVENVSASGLRIRYRGRPRHEVGGTFQMKLRWTNSSIAIDVKVVAVIEESGTTILGLKIEDCTKELAEAIRKMAIQARRWMD